MRVWWEEEYFENQRLLIQEDVLLVAKQFMVFAHIRCPKPPIRYAKGLLQSTIRMENQSYKGMEQVACYVGNDGNAYYMPYTNEKWVSPRWHGKQNPNQDWWDKAIYDIGDLASKKGVKYYG